MNLGPKVSCEAGYTYVLGNYISRVISQTGIKL